MKPPRKVMTMRNPMRLAVSALALTLGFAQPAQAAEIGDYHDTTTPSAHPTLSVGLPMIWLVGEIVEGDAKRFAKVVRALPKPHRGFLLALNSEGGDFNEGLKIADIIHQAVVQGGMEVDVVLIKDDICVSSCVSIFAAASQRFVQAGSIVGVHTSVMADTNQESTESIVDSVAWARTLWSRGMPLVLVGKLIATSSREAEVLTEDDLKAWPHTEILPPTPDEPG